MKTTWLGLGLVTLLCLFVLLPFLHHYMDLANAEELDLQKHQYDALQSLRELKKTSTLYDEFIEQRKARAKAAAKARLDHLHEQEQPGEQLQATVPSVIIPRSRALKTKPPSTERLSKLDQYLAENDNTLPVLVLCHDRPIELGEVLDSLLSITPKPPPILVAQDGDNVQVRHVAESRNLPLFQNVQAPQNPPPGGGEKISQHYLKSLTRAFDETFPSAPGIIVLEDDLKVAPDFLAWFVQASRAVVADESLWCASAWNDNGFKSLLHAQLDLYKVKRTVLFPGLGWLLLRSEFDANLRNNWPLDQWDWHVRRVFQTRDRECIHPEIPRVTHIRRSGKGTFATQKDQEEIFNRMAFNVNSAVDWTGSEEAQRALSLVKRDAYDARLALEIESGLHFEGDFKKSLSRAASVGQTLVVWFWASPEPQFEDLVREFCRFFGIWHQLIRGSHEGVHELRYEGKVLVLLINTFDAAKVAPSPRSIWFTPYHHVSKFVSAKPETAQVFTPQEFLARIHSSSPSRVAKSREYGQDCVETCMEVFNSTCNEYAMHELNTCSALQRAFDCHECERNQGPDQPCFVNPLADVGTRGMCLINGQHATCKGRHEHTKRLCACV